MKIKDFEKNFKGELKKATLTLLLRDGEVLLAMKKRGFGVGKWNGTGGKVQQGESIKEAAIREAQEEIKVLPKKLKEAGVLNFYFPKDNFAQQVYVFVTSTWEGVPSEGEEMKPKWFKINEVPYDEMWWDDKFWMPMVFKGAKVKGSFIFEGDKLLDYYLIPY